MKARHKLQFDTLACTWTQYKWEDEW